MHWIFRAGELALSGSRPALPLPSLYHFPGLVSSASLPPTLHTFNELEPSARLVVRLRPCFSARFGSATSTSLPQRVSPASSRTIPLCLPPAAHLRAAPLGLPLSTSRSARSSRGAFSMPAGARGGAVDASPSARAPFRSDPSCVVLLFRSDPSPPSSLHLPPTPPLLMESLLPARTACVPAQPSRRVFAFAFAPPPPPLPPPHTRLPRVSFSDPRPPPYSSAPASFFYVPVAPPSRCLETLQLCCSYRAKRRGRGAGRRGSRKIEKEGRHAEGARATARARRWPRDGRGRARRERGIEKGRKKGREREEGQKKAIQTETCP